MLSLSMTVLFSKAPEYDEFVPESVRSYLHGKSYGYCMIHDMKLNIYREIHVVLEGHFRNILK